MEKSNNPNDFINDIYERIDILSMADNISTLDACQSHRHLTNIIKTTKNTNVNEKVAKLRKAFDIKNECERNKAIPSVINFEKS